MAFEFEAPNLKHKNIIFICSTNFHLIKNNATMRANISTIKTNVGVLKLTAINMQAILFKRI